MLAALCIQVSPSQAQHAHAPASKLIVPYPAGGVVDVVARILAPGLRQSLAHEVVVENLSGAAGTIGLQKLVDSTPDTGDIALGTDSDAILAPLTNTDVRFSPSQIRLVSAVASAPMALVSGPTSSFASIEALITAAAGRRIELSCGNYGIGSNSQLVAQDLADRLGFRCLHVAYRGVAPLLQDLMSGQVQISFLPLAASIPDLIRSGKLTLLAIAADRRSRSFASVPTFVEVRIPEFSYQSWNGIMMPASASQVSVNKVHAALSQTLRDPGVRARIEAAQLEPAVPMSLNEAELFFAAESRKYAALVARSRTAPAKP